MFYLCRLVLVLGQVWGDEAGFAEVFFGGGGVGVGREGVEGLRIGVLEFFSVGEFSGLSCGFSEIHSLGITDSGRHVLLEFTGLTVYALFVTFFCGLLCSSDVWEVVKELVEGRHGIQI